MQQELISLAGQAAVSTVKNTHLTVNLTGWPGTVAVIGLGLIAGATAVGICYINSMSDSSYVSYDA